MATLRQLEYLVTVVDQGSFTRAAELLHVTQPALSHQIRALERSAGSQLLERLPKNIRLTPSGRAMLPHARAALADAERARCAARQTAGLEAGELQIATLYSLSLGVLPAALRAWRREHPDVGIRLYEHRHTDELVEAMRTGQADLAVGPDPTGWSGVKHLLGEEELVVVVAADDPLLTPRRRRRRQHTVELTELAERAWVHYVPGHGLGDMLDLACAQAGFEPRIAVRTEQTAAAPALAAAGLGPALVPANILPPGFDGHVLHPEPRVCRTLAAYTRGTPDPLAAAFVDVLRTVWAEGNQGTRHG
ncbi:DNA-binding transcriptional LysR family regulator [Kribbella amoyensis]|uniref:DNA-binding transcriptional LysR family regulator n=1 Tax=Kribbella amoyensis TaxID=996641 RepID=A0A561BM75_9ACTN|nr:LysR family transcriptional regulator [Kribbella amoyensis]TWD79965.1 DNA-binding transcriptional LysR family regulator [Kribbella amoyensis]